MGQGTVQLLTAAVTAQTDGGLGAPTVGFVSSGTYNGVDLKPAFIPPVSVLIPPASLPLTALAQSGATAGQAMEWNGAAWAPAAVAVGTVTSVAMTVPGVLFSVAGSPITSAGTLALSLLTQAANTVLAGPVSGGAATPTVRALVTADLPAGTGTVTSVAASVPAFLSIAGSPITTAGTLAITLSGTALPTANGGTGLTTFAATNGLLYASSASVLAQVTLNATATKEYLSQTSSGVPVFAQVAAADISGLAASATIDTTNAANITSGTLATGRLTGSYVGITTVGTLTTLAVTGSITSGGSAVAIDNTVVHLAGIETITGVKTFTANPVFNTGAIPSGAVSGLAAIATSGSATDLIAGTLPAARLSGAYTVTSLNATSFLQLNSLAKLQANATDGYINQVRSDGALGTSTPVGFIQTNGAGNQGVFLGTFSNADFRFLGTDGVTDSVTVRMNNLRASGYVSGAQFRSSFSGTFGIYTGSTFQFAFNNGTLGSTTNSDLLLLFATSVDTTGANITVNAAASNFIYSSRGSAGTRVITLPPAPYIGQRICFQAYNSKIMKIQANTGQTIQIGATVSAAAGSATSATDGSSVWLTLTVANTWEADSFSGTWTVV